ncbi:hypothetical protein [Sphingomonas sp.]|uniref:hypothetical protein n=1 Tax=Sphingomonas sp. TaxID=28214 RepID=UPI001B049119|nr:hypothetical protein [Sphingomonas sp.]MBO9712710.1 hypothetical protein [Sphingomonas sp.]
MYSESDLAGAVEAGAISREAAEALRNHVAESRAAPAVDEEHFKLLTGFNDIFVAIATVLMLVAVGRIGAYFADLLYGGDNEAHQIGVGVTVAGFAVAATSWLLGEYFTRRRRMALPSILLLLAFVGGIAAGVAGLFTANWGWLTEQLHIPDTDLGHRQYGAGAAAIVAITTAVGAWVHWKRFMVPITVAAATAAVIGLAVALVLALVPDAIHWINPILLGAGVLVFAFAMRWDVSDLERRTRRSDVAFWLHLAAAPLIAHPIFQMLGVLSGDISGATAGIVIALYIGFALVALAVDRRALLVSSLVYVLAAMYTLFRTTGNVELSASLTALVIGSALLTLSAFWHPMRRAVVGLLGGIGESLPPTQQPALA